MNMDAESTRKSLCKFWIHVCAGASDYLHNDADTNFNSATFKAKAGELGTAIRIVSTEAHDRTCKVERIYAYLQTLYNKLGNDLPQTSRE